MAQQDCTPFSPDFPQCLNNKTQQEVHASLAQAILQGAMSTLQAREFRDNLAIDPVLDTQTQQFVASYPILGD